MFYSIRLNLIFRDELYRLLFEELGKILRNFQHFSQRHLEFFHLFIQTCEVSLLKPSKKEITLPLVAISAASVTTTNTQLSQEQTIKKIRMPL